MAGMPGVRLVPGPARPGSAAARGTPVGQGLASGGKGLAAAAEDQAAADEAVGAFAHEAAGSAAELLADEEITAPDRDGEAALRIGSSIDDIGGEGAARGLILRVTGEGVQKVRVFDPCLHRVDAL